MQGGSDLALRDIMSASDGNVFKGDTTYHVRAGLPIQPLSAARCDFILSSSVVVLLAILSVLVGCDDASAPLAPSPRGSA